jgi:hypothetical protein
VLYNKQWGYFISIVPSPPLCSLRIFELKKVTHLFCVQAAEVEVGVDACRTQAHKPRPQGTTHLLAAFWARRIHEHVYLLALVSVSTSVSTELLSGMIRV